MAFEDGTSRKECPECGAWHELKWSRMPVREWATVRCQVCAAFVVNGKTLHDYHQVTLLDDA